MAEVASRYLGAVDLEKPDIYCDLPGGRGATVMLFSDVPVDAALIQAIDAMLDKLASLDAANLAAIAADYASGDRDSAVRDYVEHHLDPEIIEHSELEHLVNFDDKSRSPEQQMLAAFRLKNVSFHPEPGSVLSGAVFDYSIDPELTQYVIGINVNHDGSIEEISMES